MDLDFGLPFDDLDQYAEARRILIQQKLGSYGADGVLTPRDMMVVYDALVNLEASTDISYDELPSARWSLMADYVGEHHYDAVGIISREAGTSEVIFEDEEFDNSISVRLTQNINSARRIIAGQHGFRTQLITTNTTIELAMEEAILRQDLVRIRARVSHVEENILTLLAVCSVDGLHSTHVSMVTDNWRALSPVPGQGNDSYQQRATLGPPLP